MAKVKLIILVMSIILLKLIILIMVAVVVLGLVPAPGHCLLNPLLKRFRANSAHIRQSPPDYGLGLSLFYGPGTGTCTVARCS